ncbi:hypothetical protein BD769DRAFT_1666403 [Suillus cothurnatus]|nr:hypothetical protein BD769DRAFT_1666403 [Suillus cothurnatus]
MTGNISMSTYRDMFMCFCGGGIGHKITREWDEFLQHDGTPDQQDAAASDVKDLDIEGAEGDLEEELVEFDKDQDDRETDDEEEGDEEEDDENDPDRVIPDSDEELDNDILAQAGYGVL